MLTNEKSSNSNSSITPIKDKVHTIRKRFVYINIHISDSLNGSLAVVCILRTARAIQGGIKTFREKQSIL